MFIEDTWTNPFVCAVFSVVMAFILYRAWMRVKQMLGSYGVTCIMFGTMFSMLMMMASSSIPNGANCHIIGSVLLAITVGPWLATIATSVALLIQAVLFGNGGIIAFGANALNLAVIMPWSGYWIYRVVAGKTSAYSVRQMLAAGLAGCAGFNLATFGAVVECKLVFAIGALSDITHGLGTAAPLLNQLVLGSVAEGIVVAVMLKLIFLKEWSGDSWLVFKKN